MNFLDTLQALCLTAGISGREQAVRTEILRFLSEYGIPSEQIQVDRLGNLLVRKKGAARPKRRILFSAHMDEVGMMVTAIHEDGTLAFGTVGGVQTAALAGRTVQIHGKSILPGVIGSRPVHHLSTDAKKTPVPLSELVLDIGTRNRAETERLVHPGDAVSFARLATEFGEDSFAACAIDDRFGCAVLLELLSQDLPYDTDFSFVVQEEVGLRGAAVAARASSPDLAVVLEATTAADLPDVQGADAVCRLGQGAVLSYMDGRTIYDKELYDFAVSCCESHHIAWQTKSKIAGGNDAGAIQNIGEGVRVMAISIPCRYLHAPVSVMRLSDAAACRALVAVLAKALQEELP